jgi:hypothetical protein
MLLNCQSNVSEQDKEIGIMVPVSVLYKQTQHIPQEYLQYTHQCLCYTSVIDIIHHFNECTSASLRKSTMLGIYISYKN